MARNHSAPIAGLRFARPLDARVQAAVAALARAPVSVPNVAAEVGVSERQLERLFRERVGIAPKHYARIARLERAVALSSCAVTNQAELALRAGYSDESHLLRDFRELVGVTPSALCAERNVGFVQAASGEAQYVRSHEARKNHHAASRRFD